MLYRDITSYEGVIAIRHDNARVYYATRLFTPYYYR